jgi:hypothetical protein
LNIVHLKPKMTPLLSRFLQNNIRASLDKLALRDRGVGQKFFSGPLIPSLTVRVRNRKYNCIPHPRFKNDIPHPRVRIIFLPSSRGKE